LNLDQNDYFLTRSLTIKEKESTMDDEHTQWQPVEPTTPVTNPYEYIGIPPPPPKPPRRVSKMMWIAFINALLLVCSAVLFYWSYTYRVDMTKTTPVVIVVTSTPRSQATGTQQAIATPEPTVYPYTAQDILNEMIAHNLRVDGPAYGETLAYFFVQSTYNDVVSIPFQSSAIWGVAGQGAGGYCDSCDGLWVYSSYDLATAVEQKLVTDGSIAEQTPQQGPTAYPVVTHYGRCVANGVSGTPFATVMKQYCV